MFSNFIVKTENEEKEQCQQSSSAQQESLLAMRIKHEPIGEATQMVSTSRRAKKPPKRPYVKVEMPSFTQSLKILRRKKRIQNLKNLPNINDPVLLNKRLFSLPNFASEDSSNRPTTSATATTYFPLIDAAASESTQLARMPIIKRGENEIEFSHRHRYNLEPYASYHPNHQPNQSLNAASCPYETDRLMSNNSFSSSFIASRSTPEHLNNSFYPQSSTPQMPNFSNPNK